MNDNPLLCVVTGMERSGTTLLSQLLNSHPLVASGFECGLLLRELHELSDSKPWWNWLCDPALGWGLDEPTRHKLTTAPNHATAFRILNDQKGRRIVDPKAREIFRESPLLVDKTPAYVRKLSIVMLRTDRPVLVTWKTPEEAWESYRWRGVALPSFLATYLRSAMGLGNALRNAPERITVISYRSLAGDTARVMAKVAQVLNLPEPHDLSLERYRAKFAGMLEDETRRRAAGLFTVSGFGPDSRPYRDGGPMPELEPVSELMWTLYLADVAEDLELIQSVMI